MRTVFCATLLLITGGLAGLLMSDSASSPTQAADKPAATKAANKSAALKPVEPDMHEFMEYVFQPTYKRLKVAMEKEPAERRGWKPIKADALILAEGGTLTMLRGPKENRAEWNKLCGEVRDLGGQLYRAAKKRDYKTARISYTKMIQSCNNCHKKFAGGEHQLTP